MATTTSPLLRFRIRLSFRRCQRQRPTDQPLSLPANAAHASSCDGLAFPLIFRSFFACSAADGEATSAGRQFFRLFTVVRLLFSILLFHIFCVNSLLLLLLADWVFSFWFFFLIFFFGRLASKQLPFNSVHILCHRGCCGCRRLVLPPKNIR